MICGTTAPECCRTQNSQTVQVSTKGACLPRCLPAGDPIQPVSFQLHKAFVGVLVQILLVYCPTWEQVQKDAHVFKILKGSGQVKFFCINAHALSVFRAHNAVPMEFGCVDVCHMY